MVNSCPEAAGPEEMNTVQIRYVHTPAGVGGWGVICLFNSGYASSLKANTNIQKPPEIGFDSSHTGHLIRCEKPLSQFQLKTN